MCDHKGTDILAIETIPCLKEAKALLILLKTRPEAKAWVSVSTNAVATLVSGESLEDFVRMVEEMDPEGQVEALGVNCSDPKLVEEQLVLVRKFSQRPIIMYPNAGNIWNTKVKEWIALGDAFN
jgi:homocysteine S-methyltransferase